jgi:uncharacterized Rossmann fold enzyme
MRLNSRLAASTIKTKHDTMKYTIWEPLYRDIAQEFHFSYERETQAAILLNSLLHHKQRYSVSTLEQLLNGQEIIICGAGPSLSASLITYQEKLRKNLVITADGATTALLEQGRIPDIIVTDLDGKVSDQIHANKQGSLVIIHAHGDNTDLLRRYVPQFPGPLMGSTQIDPGPFDTLHNYGGFTDGDRAVFLASHFHAHPINLVGFDCGSEIGSYSFPNKKSKSLKRRKLHWCKQLIDTIATDADIRFLQP